MMFSPTDAASTEVDGRPELDHLADFTARRVTNHDLRQMMRNRPSFVTDDGTSYRWAAYDGPGTDTMIAEPKA